MSFMIESACYCLQGNIRTKNEDNFYFNGKYLNIPNCGLKAPLHMKKKLNSNIYLAIFDGMGGEYYGDIAAYSAACYMKQTEKLYFRISSVTESSLKKLFSNLNEIVNDRKKELKANRMGSTMALLCFSRGKIYSCNMGDSRIYRFRKGEFTQLSEDHVLDFAIQKHRKLPLFQHLGMDTSEIQIEPYIFKEKIKDEDRFLLCSDGLTDMLTNDEIACIMHMSIDETQCVEKLMKAALDKGGEDNISIIACKITNKRNKLCTK